MILYGPDGDEIRDHQPNGEALDDPPLISRCAALLLEMLGPGVAIAVARPAIVTDLLLPEEQQFLIRSVAKRQAEFGTARLCARRALAQFGIAAGPLVPQQDRSPLWPSGMIGSISHTVDCCAVAVARIGMIAALGHDIEADTPLKPDMERMICTEAERAFLSTADPEQRGQLGKLVFSAKEAFYKCQYPLTKTFLGFHDVAITIDLAAETFALTALSRAGGIWERLYAIRGRFRRVGRLVVTSALLPSDAGNFLPRDAH